MNGLGVYGLAQTKEQTKPEKGGEAPESIGPKEFCEGPGPMRFTTFFRVSFVVFRVRFTVFHKRCRSSSSPLRLSGARLSERFLRPWPLGATIRLLLPPWSSKAML